ncbi:MAG: hypothetical protein IBX72_14315 [Nitrospirae bacterium]|nr:hypothetical protein [Nitrospirota bacterium]
MPESQARGDCECLWKKMIGKPYSGKPNVRFDVAGDGEVLQVISVVTRLSLTLLKETKPTRKIWSSSFRSLFVKVSPGISHGQKIASKPTR